eukprot:TRINITY_DN1596_c0_g1_i1.p1 TRINITY_DN1596_c0_g1~~TRINITY_DN1596_c0_g1_i1.p1  ORF type:complete len:250 (+),score=50.79 TRINITY_DN1596_c0_g1_i1:116-865(+)
MGKIVRELNAMTWFVLLATIVVEMYTYVLPVMLPYSHPKQKAFITFSITTIPRCLFWISVDFYLGGFGDWWKKYFTLDILVPAAANTCIVYGFLLINSTSVDPLGWKIASVVALPFLLACLSGHVRVMVRHFPWTRWTILIYRLNRAAGIILTMIVELLSSLEIDRITTENAQVKATQQLLTVNNTLAAAGIPGFTTVPVDSVQGSDDELLDPRIQIIFIGAIVGYYTVLYATLPKWESIRKARAAAAK